MRKIFILSILFAMSFFLKQYGILSDTHNSVLLAIGVVILAAYTLSEIGSHLKLPQVTGYILTGLLLGPYALKILSKNVVDEIEMFNTLAIGLIAMTAGLELHFSSLKKVILPILSTSLMKIVALMTTSIAIIYVVNQQIYDFQVGMGLPLLSLAVIFGVLALGTSPAISIAVISEMKAKSRMSQMVLGSAIVKDVLVVILLAVAISFAKSVGGEGDPDITTSFIHLMEELGYSLLAGLLLGLILIGYIKYINQEMLLFVAAVILGTAELSEAIHLELLLVFIVAGIVVRNFSKDQEILHDALHKVSLPVFVVFFTNVGAGLNLSTTWQFLPVAGLLFAGRALSFISSSWVSGKIHNESSTIRNRIWLGYLPQAGVTLGLIQIAARDLPSYSDLITNVGIGLVTLNLLIGPIFLRLVLKAEEPDQHKDESIGDDQRSDDSDHSKSITKSRSQCNQEEFNQLVQSQAARIEDPELQTLYKDFSIKIFDIFRKNQLLPQKNILNNFTAELQKIDQLSEQEVVAKIDNHFRKMGEKGSEIFNAITLLQKELDHLQVVLVRPYPKTAIETRSNDSLWIKFKKIIARPYFWTTSGHKRDVPLRKLVKYNIEPFIAGFSLQLINSWYRLLGKHIDSFQNLLDGHLLEGEQVTDMIGKENEIWVSSSLSDFMADFNHASDSLVWHLNKINTCYLSDNQIRYSQVKPQITEQFEKAKKDSQVWEEKFIYCRNRLKVIVQSALLSTTVEKLLEDKFFAPVKRAEQNADELVKDVFAYFEAMRDKISSPENLSKAEFEKLHKEAKAFSEERLQADLKTKYVRGSFRLLNRDISLNLKKNLPKEEGSFQIASEQTPAHKVSDPAEIVIKKINLYELFEQSILINFLPTIEERIEGVSNYLESLLMEMEQAFHIINYSLESHISGESHLGNKELIDSILTTLSSEKDKISELHQGLLEFIHSSSEATAKLLEECQQEVRQGVERFSVVNTAKNQFRQKLQSTVQKVGKLRSDIDSSVEGYYQKIKQLGLSHNERDIDKALKKKILSKTLDTTTVRQFINETYSLNFNIENLPRLYFRLFTLDPIQDKRFFIAHKSKSNQFSLLKNQKSRRESQKILIIGDRGIGKSSLINVVQMEIETGQLIRLEADDKKGPIYSLARSLGCSNSQAAISKTLREMDSTVVIDNVDQMLSRKNLKQFESLMEIIKLGSHSTHWILSLSKYNLNALDQSFKLRSQFNKLIDLTPIKLETAKETILSRHRLSGLDINYPKTFISDFAMKMGVSTEDEMFFRVLYERSYGQLRHLIYLWLLSIESCDGRNINLSLSKSVERGLPMIHEFSLVQKYILNEIYCYHNLSTKTLSENLGVSYSIIDNEVQYLEHCGLINTRGIDRSIVYIPETLVMPVGFELKKEGILYEGFNQFRK